MKPITAILALCLAFAATSASPLAEPDLDIDHVFENPNPNPLLEKRGYGCNCFTSDDVGICNLHCLNNVRITCSNGSKIKPYKGVCGGFCTATCQCVYNKSCP